MDANDPGCGCTWMKCTDFKDGVCLYERDYCKYNPDPDGEIQEEIGRLRAENERFREAFKAIKANPTYSYLDAIRMKNIADAATDGRVCKCADNQGGPCATCGEAKYYF